MVKIIVFMSRLGLIFCLFLLQAWLAEKISQREGTFISPPIVQQQKWNEQIIRMLSLGQWPAAVESLWIRALQDIELNHVSGGVHANSFFDLDLATDLDPAFFKIYYYGSILLNVVRDDNLGSKILLEKAHHFIHLRQEDQQVTNPLGIDLAIKNIGHQISKYPEHFWKNEWLEEWRISQLLAYLNLFEFNKLEIAAQYFREAAQYENAPPYLFRLEEKLSSVDGRYRVATIFLTRAQGEAANEVIKEGYAKKERDLKIEYALYQYESAFREYLKKITELKIWNEIPYERLQKHWVKFLNKYKIAPLDPYGGKIYISRSGEVLTTSQFDRVPYLRNE